MKVFKAENVNHLYAQVAKDIVSKGSERDVRGFHTKEVSEECCLILENPTQCVVTLPARHPDERIYKYLEYEFKWFKSGSLSIEGIKPFTFWDKLANPDQTINSNYGYYTFFQPTPEPGQSQFEWCLKRLQKDIYTRQAVININQPMHKVEGNQDFCCTIGQQFLYRNGKLDCIVWMRSNDIIFGTSYNIPWFTFIQWRIADALGIPVGRYIHMVSTLHVYEPHYLMLEQIAKSEDFCTPKSLNIWKYWERFSHEEEGGFWEKAYREHTS